jgi:hypothetical protein
MKVLMAHKMGEENYELGCFLFVDLKKYGFII